MKSFIINSNDAGQRVSKFIEKTVPALPQGLLYKSFRLKRIKLNKKRCQPQDRLSQGDLLELYINDEFFGEGRQDLVFLKVPDRIQVVYEDQNILLVDKKPGLVVHEDDDNTPDTLINRILHYLYNKGEYQPDAEQSFVPALCNRIDRNTGGIVIAAKNAQALRILNQKVKDRELTKLYLCLVHGVMQPKSGTLRDFLLKDSQRNQVRVFKNQVPGSKTAPCAPTEKPACWRWTLRPDAPTRSVRTWRFTGIRWSVTPNTAPTPRTRATATTIRRCMPTSFAFVFPPMPAFFPIWMAKNFRWNRWILPNHSSQRKVHVLLL